MIKNPLRSVQAFEKWLGTMTCLACKYIEQSSKPIPELKCTHENANKETDMYENGFEADKDEIRKEDIKRGYHKDVNEYFVCTSFDDTQAN